MFYTSYIINSKKKAENVHAFQTDLLFSKSHNSFYSISDLQRGLHYILDIRFNVVSDFLTSLYLTVKKMSSRFN